jgi:hypothetical protein
VPRSPEGLERRREQKKLASRRYRAANPEKVRAYHREWSAKRRERDANFHRQRTYGISPEQYEEMLKRQGGVCAICGRGRKLCVDHDHDTGHIRGLLCKPCNSSIGQLGDDVEGLKKAISYLEEGHGIRP